MYYIKLFDTQADAINQTLVTPVLTGIKEKKGEYLLVSEKIGETVTTIDDEHEFIMIDDYSQLVLAINGSDEEAESTEYENVEAIVDAING